MSTLLDALMEDHPYCHRCHDAAAEIRQLQAERETWDRRVAYDELKAREYENRAMQQNQIDRLTLERDRLRDALRLIADDRFTDDVGLQDIARRALE